MWFKKVHSAVALDVGAGSISLCQLAHRAGTTELYRWGVVEDPLHAQPATADLRDLSVERTARSVSQSGFCGRTAALAFKPPDASFHAAALPDALRAAPRLQQLATLQFDAARQMQADPAEVCVDFWPLPPGNRSGNNVMIAAARREVVDRWSAFVDAVGLELWRIDVLPHALLRSAWRAGLPGQQAQRPVGECLWGILDVGFSGSLLVIVLGHACVYVRTSPVGGDALTTTVGESLHVDYGTAETLKRRHTLQASAESDRRPASEPPPAPPDAEVKSGRTDELDDLVHTVLRSRLRSLADDIGRAFAYAMESYPAAVPTGLYVCGGGAKLARLPEVLGGLLGVDVARLNPCAGMASARAGPPVQEVHQPNLAGCVGLALGDVE